MNSPFTAPPRGTDDRIVAAWSFLEQKWQREAAAYQDLAECEGDPAEVRIPYERAAAFAEHETDNAVSLYLDAVRDVRQQSLDPIAQSTTAA